MERLKALWRRAVHWWRWRHMRRTVKNYGRSLPLDPELVELFKGPK